MFPAVKARSMMRHCRKSVVTNHINEPCMDQHLRSAARWMTRLETPKKDVTSYDMPWRAERKLRTKDLRM